MARLVLLTRANVRRSPESAARSGAGTRAPRGKNRHRRTLLSLPRAREELQRGDPPHPEFHDRGGDQQHGGGGRTVSGLREELEQGVGMGMLCTGTVLNGHEEEPQHRLRDQQALPAPLFGRLRASMHDVPTLPRAQSPAHLSPRYHRLPENAIAWNIVAGTQNASGAALITCPKPEALISPVSRLTWNVFDFPKRPLPMAACRAGAGGRA